MNITPLQKNAETMRWDALREARIDRLYFQSHGLAEHWYAGICAPQSETEAVRQLLEAGYEAFLTSELRYRRPSQYAKRKQEYEFPLIPGLVFVGVESYADMSVIHYEMDIIQGFLGSGPESSRLRAKDLIRLREMSADAAAAPEARAMVSREEYKIGDLCKVVSGPLTSQHLKVENITGAGTDKDPYMAVVRPGFFNEAKAISLPLNSLIPV